ncbi:glycosyltransferase family 2 protein [Vicingus serpentipes]|uniref:Glycosyltransferase family 2 protein n=1 Tax=Vicingus serpentipes TaxID=1926625 RepID=A0A5C6RV35_9FLAO|nr:glycosyltransferase family 2 protein [Vicingus serpentipes]TXB65967.1 glycosyltransferase family 2 protein [Vicingus serpentipes]
MKNRLVSIIMPVKNTSKHLKECLDSTLNQSYSNWELLAVDDSSSDNSFQILTDYSIKDNRIKVFRNNGSGIIPALQLGYSKCLGNFITRMDSDDIMVDDKLYVMVNQLIENGVGNIALGLVRYFSEEGIGEGFSRYEQWLNGLISKGDSFKEIYKECVIPSPCWMMQREDFEKCGGFTSEIYPEDYDLAFRFYQNKLKCIPSEKVLHHWRDYPTRTSRTHEHYADSSFIEIKLHHFLELDYDVNKKLVVWGAGKKGKLIAELLLKRNIPFSWICDNPKKIGKDIYNQKLLSFTELENIENNQSIVTVASPTAQKEIQRYFAVRERLPMVDYFFFC